MAQKSALHSAPGPLLEGNRLGLDPGKLLEVVAGEVAPAVARQQQAAVGRGNADVLPVTRDQHVERGRGE
ncbi:MAG TPA: hypothetical protein VLM18_02515 [Croceibacterium sp.]|nr:hypothetical protein [Croceibacterium sp.]